MEDENEVLDWGHEDELAVAHGDDKRAVDVDDVEDAVSLGGDEEDEFLTYQSRVPQDSPHRAHSPPKPARPPKQDPPRAHSVSPCPQDISERTASPPLARMHAFGPLVHALPPKPVLSTVSSFVHPSNSSIIEATAMASRPDRDKRNGAPGVYDHNDALPPGWELKYPRNGRGVYYYNIHTQESTWTRPTGPSTREKRGERSDRRDDPLDSRSGDSPIPRAGRSECGDMSYDDRHYRPGESGRREERPARSSQLIDSYVPDAYSPDNGNTHRPSPPSPRSRDRDPSPPLRRPPSPKGSYGDRDDVQSSHREAPSVAAPSQDRVRALHDSVSLEHTRERRQRDDPSPPQTERRHPPRNTERSSTIRPRSPASYPRGSQESANTTPRSSIKPSQPLSEVPHAARRSRFSQVDAPAQYGRRHSESRDISMRRARTDDVPHSARYTDDIPSSRSISDIHRDDDTHSHPASDAQRPGSRKRTPLPPQDEAYLPSARSAPVQRGGSHFSGPAGPAPAPVSENRHTRMIVDDMPRDTVRRSFSPPSHPRSTPAEREYDRDRGRSRWSKPQANGPPQTDSRHAHEPPRGRARDVAMDIDDALPPRLSDPPSKQIPPRRPALQDDLPRYPRAMLNSDNDGPSRGGREARDNVDSRYRFANDGPSRFGSLRDRPGPERHSVEQTISQKEPNRSVEARPPPPASNVKLSGTNNIPIGARNKFAGGGSPTPAQPSSIHRSPAVKTGSNGEPVGPRRDRVNKDHERPLHFDSSSGDRSVPTEPVRREDVHRSPVSNPRPLPPTEPAAPPARPSRAALGISRFGPPIVKENPEPVRPPANVSTESILSEPIPEGSTRATPPPPSQESSSVSSVKDAVVPPSRPSHLPPRPASPPRGYRFANKPLHRPNLHSPATQDSRVNETNAEAPARPRPSSPTPRKRTLDAGLSELPPAPRVNRPVYNPERSRTNFRNVEGDHNVTLPPPPPVVQEEERGLPPMHPERALMLQANGLPHGLPPRPPPNVLGPSRPVRGFKRDRRDDRDHDRAEPLRAGGGFSSTSPTGERRRFPEDDRPTGYGGGGGGASLLDRLSLDEVAHVNTPSLRERVQLPSKRDREEMLSNDFVLDVETEEYDGSKRMRRRGAPRMRKNRC